MFDGLGWEGGRRKKERGGGGRKGGDCGGAWSDRGRDGSGVAGMKRRLGGGYNGRGRGVDREIRRARVRVSGRRGVRGGSPSTEQKKEGVAQVLMKSVTLREASKPRHQSETKKPSSKVLTSTWVRVQSR